MLKKKPLSGALFYFFSPVSPSIMTMKATVKKSPNNITPNIIL
jgi:hypothetical protein